MATIELAQHLGWLLSRLHSCNEKLAYFAIAKRTRRNKMRKIKIKVMPDDRILNATMAVSIYLYVYLDVMRDSDDC